MIQIMKFIFTSLFILTRLDNIFAYHSLNSHNNSGYSLRIIGSSTVYPFASLMAEQLRIISKFKSPIIESTGTGNGLNIFCNNQSTKHIVIATASRPISTKEQHYCNNNDIMPIEIVIGYDGIVVGGSNKSAKFSFRKKDLFKALSAQILVQGKIINNPYKYWNEVNTDFPKKKIQILGPSPASGLYNIFIDLAIKPYCNNNHLLNNVCGNLRKDGSYKYISESGNIIIQKLILNPNQIGIFGYNYFLNNKNLLWSASINNYYPSISTIINAEYPLAHPLYIYIRRRHIGATPIKIITKFFLSEETSGTYTTLTNNGLIPLDFPTRQLQKQYLLKIQKVIKKSLIY